MSTDQEQAKAPESEDSQEAMPFTAHLEELRNRIVRCLIASFVGFLACYGFAKELFDILMRPLVAVMPPDSALIYTGLPEGFFTYIKVAFLAGIFLASPYIFFQLWRFIAPGLYSEERRYLVPVAFFSALFFVSGAMFGYFVVFPFGFEFFMGFATDMIRPMPSLKEYFSFSVKLLFAFGLVFELPLFIFFLARMGMVTSAGLRKKQKYAILVSFIVSAILTPPDMVSQVFMAGPLIILYEASIWVAYYLGKERIERRKKQAEERAAAKLAAREAKAAAKAAKVAAKKSKKSPEKKT
ncbi:MAG: twin-arginine translocase subunit TatC [Deltaproteobacteria bacterium]|nr:twin-arginine translocase subunit TatC [Deltaproteobacteria bacterium]